MKKTYCPLPFRAAYIDPTGIKGCCRDPQWHNFSIAEWLESDKLKEIQEGILSGNMPSFCVQNCLKREEAYGQSLRTEALRDYNNQEFTDTKIDFIDFRASNVCNYKCRSCVPRFSHGINNEAQKHKELQEFNGFDVNFNTKKITINEINKDWIIDNIRDIKRLMFTGGEPTLMSEPREIIEFMLENNITDTSILITTNGSFTSDFWRDLTKNYPNLHWTFSLDGVKGDAEIIRHGTDWNLVEQNLRWLAVNAGSLDVNTVVSRLNVRRLRPILKLVNEIQELSKHPIGKQGSLGLRHQLDVTPYPYFITANNCPTEDKPAVTAYLRECLKLDLDEEQKQTISNLITSINNTAFNPIHWNTCNRYNNILDSIRDEDHTVLDTFKFD